MSILRKKMIQDMELAGLSIKTQEAYIYAVRSLAKYYMRSPDTLTEKELRDYFLYLIREKQIADGTLRIQRYGIKFLFQKTLGRDWPLLKLLRSPKKKPLPTVLSHSEVKDLLNRVRNPKYRMCLTLIYSCGLRISEATNLKVTEIDSQRMVIHVHGKGGKDRLVPLPDPILIPLREYWLIQRARPWLFPGRNSKDPLNNNNIRQALKAVVKEKGLTKHVTPHSLRHSYATHLLENRVDLRVIQALLGHTSPKTTSLYTRLTPQILANVQKTVNRLTATL